MIEDTPRAGTAVPERPPGNPPGRPMPPPTGHPAHHPHAQMPTPSLSAPHGPVPAGAWPGHLHPPVAGHPAQPTAARARRAPAAALAVSAALLVAGAAYVWQNGWPGPLKSLGKGQAAAQAQATAPATGASAAAGAPARDPMAGTRVVATVDGRTVHERDLYPLLQQGVDRAVAVDRLINRAVLADAATADFRDQAEIAGESARAEAQAGVWLSMTGDRLRKAVTDKEVQEWYAREVRDDLFRQVKLRFYLTQDPEDAKAVAQGIKGNDPASLAKLEPFARAERAPERGADKAGEKSGDKAARAAEDNAYVPLAALPYGLGKTLADAKAGFRSEPVLVRNGWFVFAVDDVKQQEKPSLDSVRERIVSAIVADRLAVIVTERRKAARIELKG